MLGGGFSVVRFLVDATISSRMAGSSLRHVRCQHHGELALGCLGAALTGTALLLAGTASIGSYTTFSTWMLEAHRLGEDDDRRPLLLYLFGSLVVGLAAAFAGRALGRTL